MFDYALRVIRPCPSNAEVVNVRVSDGAGLPSYSTVYEALATGVPLVVSGLNPGEKNLTPEYFIQRHGKTMVHVVNTLTGARRSVALARFLRGFCSADAKVNPEKLQVRSLHSA